MSENSFLIIKANFAPNIKCSKFSHLININEKKYLILKNFI